jgi:2-dehydropantoate 2-reductase
MRIAIMGAGGIGGNAGARLVAAGEDVALIARGPHLQAIRDNGLKVLSKTTGDLHIHPAMATDDPTEVGPVDVVLLTTKLYDLETATELCKPLLGPDTAVISLLNGVDAADRMVPILGAAPVVPGVAYTTANVDAPGIVRHVSGPHLIGFGELDGRRSARLDAFDTVANAAGIETNYTDAIENLLWRKFVLLVAVAGVCALSRQPVGGMRDDPELMAMFIGTADEVIAVAAAKGIDVASVKAESFKFADTAAADLKPSLLVDLERGNRLEIDWLSGTVTRLGRELGVPTPINQAIWASLRPLAG